MSPPKAQQATELVTVLRQWERLLLRADNLNIAKPDPSLLVRGLNNLVSEVWAKDKDVTFRTQLVKSRLGVDVSPTWESALQLHQHLRAESENLVNGLPTKSSAPENSRDPKLRPLQPSGPAPARPTPSSTPFTTTILRRVVEVQVVVRNVASGLQSRGGAKEELRASSFTLSTG